MFLGLESSLWLSVAFPTKTIMQRSSEVPETDNSPQLIMKINEGSNSNEKTSSNKASLTRYGIFNKFIQNKFDRFGTYWYIYLA